MIGLNITLTILNLFNFNWFESMWKRTLLYHNDKRIIAKLFSISANTPAFLNHFNDAKILYLIRDMSKFHLDKKNLLFTVDRILKNENH